MHMLDDNLVYFRRRATEELAAAECAPNAAIAAVHRSMAARYLTLSQEAQPDISSPTLSATPS
jgi:hypothetical protein